MKRRDAAKGQMGLARTHFLRPAIFGGAPQSSVEICEGRENSASARARYEEVSSKCNCQHAVAVVTLCCSIDLTSCKSSPSDMSTSAAAGAAGDRRGAGARAGDGSSS